MPKAVMVVWSNPVEGADETEYNRWYDEVHAKDVLKLEGIVSCRRLRVSDVAFGEVETPGRYVAYYEVETDDLSQIPQRFVDAFVAGELPMREDLLAPGPIVLLEEVSTIS